MIFFVQKNHAYISILLNKAVFLIQQTNKDNFNVQQNHRLMSQLEFHDRFEKMSALLQAFAYNLTKNSDDAKDLYQETAFRALINRDKFRPGTNFKAWLFTIMKNIFINNYRRKAKANTIMDSTDNLYFLNASAALTPNAAESSMMMKELTKMVISLEDSIRVPFLMHYQGYRYQEIADYLELPLGTVKSRIFFARKELKDQVQRHYGLRIGSGVENDEIN